MATVLKRPLLPGERCIIAIGSEMTTALRILSCGSEDSNLLEPE
jgi:hypothetical protein